MDGTYWVYYNSKENGDLKLYTNYIKKTGNYLKCLEKNGKSVFQLLAVFTSSLVFWPQGNQPRQVTLQLYDLQVKPCISLDSFFTTFWPCEKTWQRSSRHRWCIEFIGLVWSCRDYTGVTWPGGTSKHDETDEKHHHRKNAWNKKVNFCGSHWNRHRASVEYSNPQ